MWQQMEMMDGPVFSTNSPALKMGLKPIPFDKIGPYKDPLQASWSIKE
jgi:hypothetical protein